LHDAHFDDQHAIRRAIHAAERSLASASGRITQIEQDIAQRTHTRGDLFTMDVDGKTFIERKDAGARSLKRSALANSVPKQANGGSANTAASSLLLPP